MVNTQIELCGITLENPVMAASGTFGFGYEFSEFYDINVLGSFSFKGTTREPRYGNPTPRIAECPGGIINSVGLQNPGIDEVLRTELPKMAAVFHKPVMANISGFSLDDYVYACQKIDAHPQVGWIEANISCPNVHSGGASFGREPDTAYEVIRAIKDVTTKPVFAKLTPNVVDIADIAAVCRRAGADGISLVNTFLGMRIDLKTRKPVIANKVGGFSGDAIFPMALRMVYEVYEAVDIPIIGIGGISSADAVIEMMLAGATAVQVGAANLINPCACRDIIQALPQAMARYNIDSLAGIVGQAHG